MKIKPEHYATMQSAIVPHDTLGLRQAYINAGLSTKRYQWDIVRKAGLITWLCDTLYSYANDDHIQTALNKIIKPL